MEQKQNIVTNDELIPSAHNHAKPVLSEAVFRPMLFSTEMVRALLNGLKTQTRRVVKDNILQNYRNENEETLDFIKVSMLDSIKPKIGDVIWVRETFSQKDERLIYRSQVCSKWDLPDGFKWTPSLFMPKSVCRLFLEITNIRLERLNDISDNDSISEGIEIIERLKAIRMFKDYNLKGTLVGKTTAIESYKSLWISINGQKSWDDNPFVWAYTFKVVDCPYGFR